MGVDDLQRPDPFTQVGGPVIPQARREPWGDSRYEHLQISAAEERLAVMVNIAVATLAEAWRLYEDCRRVHTRR